VTRFRDGELEGRDPASWPGEWDASKEMPDGNAELSVFDLWATGPYPSRDIAARVATVDYATADTVQVRYRYEDGEVAHLDRLQELPSVRSVLVDAGTATLTRDLPQVEELMFLSSGKFDTSLLARLPNLRTLVLHGFHGPSLPEQLAEHSPRLRHLLVERPIRETLAPLARLEEIETARLFWASTLEPLKDCVNIRWLDSGAERGWSKLTALTWLTHVKMSSSSMRDLRIVKHWPHLRSLTCTSNKLASIAGVETLEHLTILGIRTLQRISLEPLSGLSSLEKLGVSCPVGGEWDLSPLHGLVSLKRLALDLGKEDAPPASVANLGFLPDTVTLEELSLRFMTVVDPDLSRLFRYPRLRSCVLYQPDADQFGALEKRFPSADLRYTRRLETANAVYESDHFTIRRAGTTHYFISRDMHGLLGVDNNYDAADEIARILELNAAAAEVEIEAESQAVTIRSTDLNNLRRAAEALAAHVASG
jgi:hypothetical protein